MVLTKAKEIITANPVVVFSKTYCPFCVSVKDLLSNIGTSFKAIELDSETTTALHRDGNLVPLLTEAGAPVKSSTA
ncbi:hypothetical protein R3W88_007105 [Solanum pinnatisectum]|uniref:Glutaredoxin domain-containing protein n=1 Tax=Solanum pinnatisectum TaxID=50273 RepID=A0AAV9KHE6_9SOLN|nr:hypothetical protein R3W88_007105 [Solanum pinnatisectum]